MAANDCVAAPTLTKTGTNNCPTVCLIGPSGNGKSTLGNILIGNKVSKVENTAVKGTLTTDIARGELFGKDIKVVDTVGLEYDDNHDWTCVYSVLEAISNVRDTTAVALVVNSSNPRVNPYFPILDKYHDYVSKYMLLNHLIVVFAHWKMDKSTIRQRKKRQITRQSFSESFFNELRKHYPNIKAFKKNNADQYPCIFLDCLEYEDRDELDDARIGQAHEEELKKFYDIVSKYPPLTVSINQIIIK